MAVQPAAEDPIVRLLAVAEEQLRWQRAAVLPQVRQTIERTLTTTQVRQAYELCDGTRSSTEVAADVKISKQALSGWTRRWRDVGIAFETSGRRIEHLVSLRSLGVPLELADSTD